MMQNNAVEIKKLSFSYKKNDRVLNDITLQIPKGSTLAILGKNGCGKSTLIKCMMNLLKPDYGEVLINGKSNKLYRVNELAKNIAYVSQNFSAEYEYAVKDYLLLGRAPYIAPYSMPSEYDTKIVEKYAGELGIKQLFRKSIKHLSGGQRQIVAITRALVQQTSIIIMDEPTSALDISNQIILLKVIKDISSLGKTVIFTSHNPNHALVLKSKVCLIKDGNVYYEGNADEVITDESMNIIYGKGIKVLSVDKTSYCFFSL